MWSKELMYRFNIIPIVEMNENSDIIKSRTSPFFYAKEYDSFYDITQFLEEFKANRVGIKILYQEDQCYKEIGETETPIFSYQKGRMRKLSFQP
jgi:hypothetical protein